MDLNNAKIVDVRTPIEFQSGHVEGSVNIPIDRFAAHVDELKKINETIVLCCATGGRSFMAYQFLQQNGFSNIHDGGAWQTVNMVMSNFQ